MKIEKINENQIRCTLSSNDLSSRNIRLSELAYGSDKTNSLFREMMEQASDEVGFDPDDNPLMIEAIPLSAESIMLIITKMDDPEELDTRFSRFSPVPDEEMPGFAAERLEGADSLPNLPSHSDQQGDKGAQDPQALLSSLLPLLGAVNLSPADIPSLSGTPALPGSPAAPEAPASPDSLAPSGTAEDSSEPVPLALRVFSFENLDRAMEAARACSYFEGPSTLYKNPRSGRYYLTLREPEKGSNTFMRACNQLAEYGAPVRALPVTGSYYEEHYETLIQEGAVKKLSGI